jgi:hypothetical protein
MKLAVAAVTPAATANSLARLHARLTAPAGSPRWIGEQKAIGEMAASQAVRLHCIRRYSSARPNHTGRL